MAQHALELDPGSTQARAAMGMVYMGSYRWRDAEQQFLQAIETNPREATARHWFGMLLLFRGRTAEAKTQLELAHRLDPLSPAILRELGMVCYAHGLPTLAESHLQAARALDTEGVALTITTVLGAVFLQQGRYEEALAEMRGDAYMELLAPETVAGIVNAVSRYQKTGERESLPEDLEARIVSPGMAARLYALAGYSARALDCLRRGIQAADLWILFAAVDPAFREIRETPEGKSLMAAMRRID